MRLLILLAVCLLGAVAGSAESNSAGRSVNWLAVELLKRGMRESRNAACSPYSVGSALALACAAAAGPTQDQLALAVHRPAGQVLPQYGQLRHSLETLAGPGIEWAAGNRMWADRVFEEPFVAAVRDSLGAEPAQISFAPSEQARQTINGWVSQQTKGQIGELLQASDVTTNTVLVLTNVLYFKGAWLCPFPVNATRPAPFHRENGKGDVSVPMMAQEDLFVSSLASQFGEPEGFDILELPYRGDRVVMDVILPRQQTLRQLVESLTEERLQKALDGLSDSSKVKVFLPRFKLDSRMDLQPVVQQLAGPLPFSAGCDLSRALGPAGRGLPIQAIIHAARLDTDEVGSTAAAATGGTVLRSPPEDFRADHPFLVLLRDRQTDTILFLGRVEDPSQ